MNFELTDDQLAFEETARQFAQQNLRQTQQCGIANTIFQ